MSTKVAVVEEKQKYPATYYNIPFKADVSFLQGWYIVYKTLPACESCSDDIKLDDTIMWEFEQKHKGKSKRLVCEKCF